MEPANEFLTKPCFCFGITRLEKWRHDIPQNDIRLNDSRPKSMLTATVRSVSFKQNGSLRSVTLSSVVRLNVVALRKI
jgi:hypothetical protein